MHEIGRAPSPCGQVLREDLARVLPTFCLGVSRRWIVRLLRKTNKRTRAPWPPAAASPPANRDRQLAAKETARRVPPRLLSSSYLRVRDGGLALVRWIRVGSRPLAHDGVAVDPINGN
jgi:hypothetical protein